MMMTADRGNPAPECRIACRDDCRHCAKACYDCGMAHQIRPFGPRSAWLCLGCDKVSKAAQAEAKAFVISRLQESA